jgi:hypothetical protein
MALARKVVADVRSLWRAGRCWGLCRHRALLDPKVHVRIPTLKDSTQLPVERPNARL